MSLGSLTLVVLILCSLGWSLLDVVRKRLAIYGRATAVTLAMVLVQLPLILVWAWVEASWAIEPGYWLPGGLGIVVNLVASVAYMQSVRLSPMSATLPLLALTPVFSSLFGIPLLGEVPAVGEWFGISLVVLGALLLNSRPELGLSPSALLRALTDEPGSRYMVLVALLWSIAPVFDKLALRHTSSAVHMLVLSVGISLGLALLLWRRGRLREVASLRPALVWMVLAALIGVVALGLQFFAIQQVWVGLVETVKRGLGSALALVFGHLLFAETVSRRKIAAVSLMVFGLVWVL